MIAPGLAASAPAPWAWAMRSGMPSSATTARCSGGPSSPSRFSHQDEHQFAKHLRRQQNRRLGQAFNKADSEATPFRIPNTPGICEHLGVDSKPHDQFL